MTVRAIKRGRRANRPNAKAANRAAPATRFSDSTSTSCRSGSMSGISNFWKLQKPCHRKGPLIQMWRQGSAWIMAMASRFMA
ncbi:hypothetical protein D9M69_577220 [compost metagenome]